MTQKIVVDKSEFLPVPQGTKIKYKHFYKAPDGESLHKLEDLKGIPRWFRLSAVASMVPYTGPRHLQATTAWLEDSKGNEVAEGYSICNPKDTPNKKLGRLIAHNRCIKAYRKNAAA
jgi:hypothetical protein